MTVPRPTRAPPDAIGERRVAARYLSTPRFSARPARITKPCHTNEPLLLRGFTYFLPPHLYAIGRGSSARVSVRSRWRLMNLDVNTLFLITIYVEAMLGLLLLFAWVQNANIYAVAWWGCAHLLRAGSIMLFGMYGSVPDLVS